MKYKTVGALLFIIVICVMIAILARESFTEGATRGSRAKESNYKRKKNTASQKLDNSDINIATGERINASNRANVENKTDNLSKDDASKQYNDAQNSVQIIKPVASTA